jgi:hypothetical protein
VQGLSRGRHDSVCSGWRNASGPGGAAAIIHP